MESLNDEQMADREQLVGKAALIASVGGTRGYADWTNPDHRLRRLLAEFLGMAGLTFVLSGGAAILARYGGHGLQPWQVVLVSCALHRRGTVTGLELGVDVADVLSRTASFVSPRYVPHSADMTTASSGQHLPPMET
jgi:putative intracellular protease/amidase